MITITNQIKPETHDNPFANIPIGQLFLHDKQLFMKVQYSYDAPVQGQFAPYTVDETYYLNIRTGHLKREHHFDFHIQPIWVNANITIE